MGPTSPDLSDYMLRQFSQAVKFTAGGAAYGQTLKSYTGKQATSTTVTTTISLETVTTGKTFFITDIYMATDIASATQILDVQLQTAGVTIFRGALHNLSPIDFQGIESQPNCASAQLVTILLPVTASGVVNFWYYVGGFEQ
jgi:hypothetical protein